MKAKIFLAVAAALTLGACVAPDYDFDSDGRYDSRYERDRGYDDRDDMRRGERRYDDRHDDRRYDDRREERREERRRTSESRRWQSYSCENGLSVQARNLNNNQLELRLDDKRAVLSSDVSGSGSRYTSNRGLFGKGAEWHEKNGEAFFAFTDPYGNQVDTSCRVR